MRDGMRRQGVWGATPVRVCAIGLLTAVLLGPAIPGPSLALDTHLLPSSSPAGVAASVDLRPAFHLGPGPFGLWSQGRDHAGSPSAACPPGCQGTFKRSGGTERRIRTGLHVAGAPCSALPAGERLGPTVPRYALNAAAAKTPRLPMPRRRSEDGVDAALEEDLVEVRLTVQDPRCWLTSLSDGPRVEAQVTGRIRSQRTTYEVVQIAAENGLAREMVEAIRAHPHVLWARSRDLNSHRTLALVQVRGCRACALCTQAGAVLAEVSAAAGGGLECTLIAQNRQVVRQIVTRLKLAGCSPVVRRAGAPTEKVGITARQREVLRTAVERGYFDPRRGVGLAELAQSFHVSKEAVRRTLQRAERRLARGL